MKKVLLIVMFLIGMTATSFAQDISGKWLGKLNVGMELQVVFNITASDSSLTTLMDSPDQQAFDIPTGQTTFINNELIVTIPLIQGDYKGTYDPNTQIITGTWTQGPSSWPLDLAKVTEVKALTRSQDPVKPYPYKEEEVSIPNAQATDVVLAGTLTIPEGNGPFPAVVLVTGSGPQDRNESLLGHRPFLVLSDYLTRNGIMVLRYDDRGIAGSTGDFAAATSYDLMLDANAAVNYLAGRTDLPISKIGIAGHSEGGLIAPLAASENKRVDFVVLLAGTGLNGDSILSLQGNLIAKAEGFDSATVAFLDAYRHTVIEAVKATENVDDIAGKLIAINKQIITTASPEMVEKLEIAPGDTALGVDFYANKWMQYFLNYDPQIVLRTTTIPVLAINGTKDLQVPYKENLDAIEAALKVAGNKQYKVVALDNLNHLFQTTTTGAPSEYGMLDETFNVEAMELVAKWILKLK